MGLILRMFFFLILLIVAGGLAWIRLAPSDAQVWHVDPKVSADQDLADGVRRRIAAGELTLSRLHAVILETPRTEVFAGGLAEGHVTYITRSKWLGFPDYTTVLANDDVLEVWARLRFGVADTGTNKRRVEGWLTTLARLDVES